MPLPPFEEFLAWVDENVDDIFPPAHMDIVQFQWPIGKEEFNALLEKIEKDSIQYSSDQAMAYLRAYHLWLSDYL